MAEQRDEVQAGGGRKPYRRPAAPKVVGLAADAAGSSYTLTPYGDGPTTYSSVAS